METPTSYDQIIENSSLEERKVAALENIAESLGLLAAEKRYAHLVELLDKLNGETVLPLEEGPVLARRRQDAAAALFAASTKITGLPWSLS